MNEAQAPPPGWYVDPGNPAAQRYWDGRTWTGHARSQQANNLAVAALVCGIVGIGIGLVPLLFVPALGLGVVALSLGLHARSTALLEPAGGVKTMAMWAVVLGLATLFLAARGLITTADVFSDTMSTAECLEQAQTAEDLEGCP